MSTGEKENGNNVSKVKHDIKNQLSNITLALEQLRYETDDTNPEVTFYFDTIFSSCKNINNLLNDL